MHLPTTQILLLASASLFALTTAGVLPITDTDNALPNPNHEGASLFARTGPSKPHPPKTQPSQPSDWPPKAQPSQGAWDPTHMNMAGGIVGGGTPPKAQPSQGDWDPTHMNMAGGIVGGGEPDLVPGGEPDPTPPI